MNPVYIIIKLNLFYMSETCYVIVNCPSLFLQKYIKKPQQMNAEAEINRSVDYLTEELILELHRERSSSEEAVIISVIIVPNIGWNLEEMLRVIDLGS